MHTNKLNYFIFSSNFLSNVTAVKILHTIKFKCRASSSYFSYFSYFLAISSYFSYFLAILHITCISYISFQAFLFNFSFSKWDTPIILKNFPALLPLALFYYTYNYIELFRLLYLAFGGLGWL